MLNMNSIKKSSLTSVIFRSGCYALLLLGLLAGCNKPPQPELRMIRMDPAVAAQQALEIRQQVAAEVAEGLELSLWAVDSLAADPIALTMDHLGRAYITRAVRQKHSEFDIRGHRDWMTESISLETVEDRRAFLHKIFAPERSAENTWLADLNGDSIHDWHDLAVEKDQVWRIEDASGDGIADQSLLVLEDFNTEITDVAGALCLYDNEMFVGTGPDMWRLRDESGDGVIDFKESISHGYNVHIGFSGHGMSGLTVGPDGKIWWSIGDPGINITAPDGKRYVYPNQGVIVRANPDGSDFEVFAAGLRNTHEFAFDQYGNLISEDNDGDHAGESERLVYIVNGSDAGWRTNWQFGKYTDPDNNGYKVWMDEELYLPRHEKQAAYIVPPIRNYHNGPTGMRYNPGTALGEKWYNKFFLAEFRGTPTRSNVYAFDLKPEGAGFAFGSEEKVLGGVLTTGIEFGPEGALYAADWIDGWGTKDNARIWKLDVPGGAATAIRQETKALLQEDLTKRADAALLDLLHHQDMRVRKQGQFELARRGKAGAAILEQAMSQREHQLARIHGIWGTAQLARKQPEFAVPIMPLLTDADPEIRAQAARWLGDVRYAPAGEAIVPLLKDGSPRVRFFAAEALGRMAHQAAVQPLIEMLIDNDDQDVYLRHAGALALARIGQADPLVALADHPSRSLRIAAVVALRRMQDAGAAAFLNDADEYIVTEAARAIHDDWSIEPAMPALAALLGKTSFTNEALIRRSISANLRLGKQENLERIAAYAQRKDIPEVLRAEAIAVLGVWPKPSVLDRVDGRNRGPVTRDPAFARQVAEPIVRSLLGSSSPVILAATAETAGRLEIKSAAPALMALSKQSRDAGVRIATLQALAGLKDPLAQEAISVAMTDREKDVRAAALKLLPSLDLEPEKTAALLESVMKAGTTEEQQGALQALGDLPGSASGPVLGRLLSRLVAGQLNPEIELDLVEVIEGGTDAEMTEKLKNYQANKPKTDVLAMYREALFGGEVRKGRDVFRNHEAAQCTRCHAVEGSGGGGVGPDLSGIADRMSREEILRSLVDPSARIAPGYGVVTLTLKGGQTVSGILKEETPEQLVIQTSDAEPLHISPAQIESRQNAASSMPPMGALLDKRELRDLLAYLMTLQGSR